MTIFNKSIGNVDIGKCHRIDIIYRQITSCFGKDQILYIF